MATLTSPSLGRLITNVRNLLGQPSSANSTWSDLELTEYLNEAVRIYFAEVVQNLEGQFTVSTDPSSGGIGNNGNGNLTYTSGSDLVPLPSDCYLVKGVYIQRPQGWAILEYRNNLTHGYWSNIGNGDPSTYQPYYFFQGNNLVLRPVPNQTAIAAIKLDYVQFPDQMINGGDALTNQIAPIFRQMIEMYAVMKAKLKQSMVSGTDLTAIPKANLADIYKNFKDSITPRSAYPRYTEAWNPEIY